MPRLPKLTYYEILGVPESATLKMIKTAYRRRAKQTHPDKNKNASAEKNFILVQEAYEILCNPIKRSIYDEQLLSIKEAFEKSQTVRSNLTYDNTSTVDSFFNACIIAITRLTFALGGAIFGLFTRYSLGAFIIIEEARGKEYWTPCILLSGAIWVIVGLCTPISFVKRVYSLCKGMSIVRSIVLFISMELLSIPFFFLIRSICRTFGWLAP